MEGLRFRIPQGCGVWGSIRSTNDAIKIQQGQNPLTTPTVHKVRNKYPQNSKRSETLSKETGDVFVGVEGPGCRDLGREVGWWVGVQGSWFAVWDSRFGISGLRFGL
jgi:hypothetical protein